MAWCWQWSCGGGKAGDFQESFAESPSSPHSSGQGSPVLSHPTHAGERGWPVLNVLFLTEARLERGQEPEACGQLAQDWAGGFVLHSSLVTCLMQPLPVFAPRAWLSVPLPWLHVAVPKCCQCCWWWRSSQNEQGESSVLVLAGWYKAVFCLIPTEQCPECHPASHEGTGRRGAGDHPADGGQEAPEEGAAGRVTTPIPIPSSLQPQPRGAVLPTHPRLQPKPWCSPLCFPCQGMGWDAPSPEICCLCSRL